MKVPRVPFIQTKGTDRQALKQTIQALVARDASGGDPFFVVDLGDVYRKHVKWQSMLPRVQPFYAVKCCPEPKILEALATLGVNFDCASKGEIETMVKLGVDGKRIIFAHPAKAISHLLYAREVGVDLMTFDNEYELAKIKQHFPEARLVLRIFADDPKALCPLGNKFGAHPDSTLSLLTTAKTLGLNVVGVSFHVGSGCQNAAAFDYAISCARKVFDEGKLVGYNFELLDIGGGYPGVDTATLQFKDIANVVNESLDKYFGEDSKVRFIAEPGRYFVASACTLVLNVIAKKAARTAEPSFMYYMNDGLYGALNCCMYDHASVTNIQVLKDFHAEDGLRPCSIWGPTCDGIDCISKDSILPELEIGDWLYLENMGAYTLAAGSNFNGFVSAQHFYTFSASEKFDDSVLPQQFPLMPQLPDTFSKMSMCNNLSPVATFGPASVSRQHSALLA